MNQAIIQLCDDLQVKVQGLHVFFARITTRTTFVKVAGMAHNPDYTVLNYGNKSIPTHCMVSDDVEIEKLPVGGKAVKGGYSERLHILVIDEKWAKSQEKQHGD